MRGRFCVPHRLDERLLITPALLKRFEAEAVFDGGNGAYFAYLQKRDGPDGRFITHGPFGDPSRIDMAQAMFAMDMLKRLNDNIHHDGAWVIVFTNPLPLEPGSVIRMDYRTSFGRFVFMWLDQDGDVRFPVECDEPFSTVLLKGWPHWVEQCQVAWQLWAVAEQALGAKPEQKYKRAMGETAPSVR